MQKWCRFGVRERRKLLNYMNFVDGWQCEGEIGRLMLYWSKLVLMIEWEESWRRCGEGRL